MAQRAEDFAEGRVWMPRLDDRDKMAALRQEPGVGGDHANAADQGIGREKDVDAHAIFPCGP